MEFGLDADLTRLLIEQERLDEIRQTAVRRYGPDLCDLAYANPYDAAPEEVLGAIRRALESTRQLGFQYTPYGGATISRRVIAQALAQESGVPYHWTDVVLTPGAMAALNLIFRAVRREGEENEIVVVAPCWLDYPVYLAHLGIRTKFIPLAGDLHLDLDRIAAALGPATRALLFSQPANPTGVIYTGAELAQLGGLLERNAPQVMLISDEAHRDFTSNGVPPLSPAKFYARTCVVYSFGKRLLMQGQRIGYVAVSPNLPERKQLTELLTRLCRVMGFCTPTTLMQLAIRELVGIRLDYSHIFQRRRRFMEELREGGYELPMSEATFFVYPRTPIDDDFEFCRLLAEDGVLALPATVFHSQGHFRLSVTADEAHLAEAAKRLNRVIAALQ